MELVGSLTRLEPNSITVILGRLACMLFPQRQMIHYVAPELFSQDTAIVESVRNDPLRHNTGTLEGLIELLDRTMVLSLGKTKIGKHVQSVLLMHGTRNTEAAIEYMYPESKREDEATKKKKKRRKKTWMWRLKRPKRWKKKPTMGKTKLKKWFEKVSKRVSR